MRGRAVQFSRYPHSLKEILQSLRLCLLPALLCDRHSFYNPIMCYFDNFPYFFFFFLMIRHPPRPPLFPTPPLSRSRGIRGRISCQPVFGGGQGGGGRCAG